jgi:hypothetical protein
MKRTALIIVCLWAIAMLVGGCTTYSSDQNQTSYVASSENTQVSPNWSYIDLHHLYGDVGENTAAIGNAVLMWEQSNPTRQIKSMQIIYSQAASGSLAAIEGISIYSEPR